MQISEKFTCPDCKNHGIEEIMVNVTVSSEVVGFDGGEVEYGEQTNEDGEVDRYQCSTCGWTFPAKNAEELAAFLGIDLDAEEE